MWFWVRLCREPQVSGTDGWYAPYPCGAVFSCHGEITVRKRLGKKGGAGLVSAIAPVAVGVLLAYAWNAAGATRAHELPQVRVPAPYVGVAAEQAAAQAWARITPASSGSPSPSGGASGTGPAGGAAGGAATGAASTAGEHGSTGGTGPRVLASPDCIRISAPRHHTVAAPSGPPGPSATAAPAVTVVPLAAISMLPSAAAPGPKATLWPGRAETVWPGRAGPDGTGRTRQRHVQRQETRSGQCARGWQQVAKAVRPFAPERSGGRQSGNSTSGTAWPVRRSMNPLLGSSAGQRVGSARDMHADRQL
jgi:hypothetical protein